MRRLWKLLDFYNKSTLFVNEFLDELRNQKPKKIVISQELSCEWIRLWSLFMRLDCIKKMIMTANNDLSLYKRALALLPETHELIEEKIKVQSLALFIAQQDHFFHFLDCLYKKRHKTWDEMLIQIISTCIYIVELNSSISYEEKRDSILALALSVVLLDGEEDGHLLKRKRIKLDSITKAFKVCYLFMNSLMHGYIEK